MKGDLYGFDVMERQAKLAEIMGHSKFIVISKENGFNSCCTIQGANLDIVDSIGLLDVAKTLQEIEMIKQIRTRESEQAHGIVPEGEK